MRPADFGALLLLAALWGGSFLFMRVAAPSLGPVVLISVRLLLAGAILLVHAVATRQLPPLGGRLPDYLVIGVINSALPFILIATAELRLPASLAAVINSVTPLFTALAAAVWLGESLTWRKVAGLVLGLAGVAVLAGLGPVPLTPATLLSVGASLLAAACYAGAAVYIKLRASGDHPRVLTLYSHLLGGLVLLPLVPFTLPAGRPSGEVIACVVLLAVLSTALAYVIYFRLIASVGPTRTTTVAYLVPVFGMLWGALFLAEPLGPSSFIGFALIACGVALVTRHPAGERKAQPDHPAPGALRG